MTHFIDFLTVNHHLVFYLKRRFGDGPASASGARGSVLVKALCYKSEGLGFGTR
jgi:hypothetical protein